MTQGRGAIRAKEHSPASHCECRCQAKAALDTVEWMESVGAVRRAALSCIDTRNHPVLKVRDEALAEMASLLEDVVRERLDDERLAASLDGLHARSVLSDGETTLNISGAFYTLGMRAPGSTADRMLPMDARLSVEPGVVSVVRVANRDGLFEVPESERQFQRAFNKVAWQWSFELRLS